MNGGAVMGKIRKPAPLTVICKAGTCITSSSSAPPAFPQGLGYNPTGTVAALAYWSAKAIREQYLKNPGPHGAGIKEGR